MREDPRLVRLRKEKMKALRSEITKGVKSLERGEGIEYDSVSQLFDDVKSAAAKSIKRKKQLTMQK